MKTAVLTDKGRIFMLKRIIEIDKRKREKYSMESEVTVKINGKDVPLNAYVHSVFTNVLKGLADTLKDVGEPKTIEVKVEL